MKNKHLSLCLELWPDGLLVNFPFLLIICTNQPQNENIDADQGFSILFVLHRIWDLWGSNDCNPWDED